MPQLQRYGAGSVGIYPVATPGEAAAKVAEEQNAVQIGQLNRMRLGDAVAERQAKIAEARAQQEQQAYLRDAVSRHMDPNTGRPDLDGVIAEAYQRYPDLAMGLEKQIGEHRAKVADLRKKDADTEKANMEVDTDLLNRISDDATFQIYGSRLSPELQKAFNGQFNQELRDKLIAHAPDEINRLKQVSELIGKSPRESLALDLAGADSPEEWAAVWQGYQELGLKPAEIAAFQQIYGKDFTPEGLAKVRAQIGGAAKSVNQQSKDFMVDGKPVMGTFDPASGKYFVAGQDVTAKARPIQAATGGVKPGRPVVSGDANRIADFETSLNDLKALDTVIGNTGTLAKVQSWMPQWINELTGGWGDDAKSRNAVIARVKQVIGKALEGGVLRKEDEEKYKDILPTIYDSKAVAKSKVEGLRSSITKRRLTLLDSLEDAGYEVGRYKARSGGETQPNQSSGASGAADYVFDPKTGKLVKKGGG